MAVDVELLSERQRRALKGKRDNLFAWTVFLLVLIGVVFACWIGSFYVFQHPENPRSYGILRKLKKIEPPKRFEPTLAPNGRFYSAKDLLKFYADKTEAEMDQMNLELLQAYIGNYGVRELQVPYLMGNFSVLKSRTLTKADLIPSGQVALARSLEEPKLWIEQLYPADGEYVDDLRGMLQPGVEIKLERTYDLSAVLHVERYADGILQVTIVPLNYDSYGLGDGREVRLSPPPMPNLAAVLPLMDVPWDEISSRKATAIGKVEKGKTPAPAAEEKSAPVLARSGPTPDQSVTRVARAMPLSGTPPPRTATPDAALAAAKPVAGATPSASPSPLAAVTTPSAVASAVATVAPTPLPTPKTVVASSAAPTPKVAARWATYRPGQMPRGRLLNVPDLEALAKGGGPKGTTYLQGNFVVRANDGNRAVMRASNRLVNALGLSGQGQTRVVVEYPEGQTVPRAGSQVTRDGERPFQITAVRKDEKGNINVFVREVTAP